jgi:hypothetical protein
MPIIQSRKILIFGVLYIEIGLLLPLMSLFSVIFYRSSVSQASSELIYLIFISLLWPLFIPLLSVFAAPEISLDVFIPIGIMTVVMVIALIGLFRLAGIIDKKLSRQKLIWVFVGSILMLFFVSITMSFALELQDDRIERQISEDVQADHSKISEDEARKLLENIQNKIRN